MVNTRNAQSASSGDVAQPPLAGLAGPLALAAGALFTITQLVTVATLDHSNLVEAVLQPVYLVNGIAYFGSFCLLLLALIAAHGRQAHRAGTFGAIGFSAAIVGTFALGANVGWFDVFVPPWLALAAPEAFTAPKNGSLPIGGFSSYVLFVLGWVLFGLASLRARVFPLAISLALVVSALLAWPSALPPYGVPFGQTIAALGVWMLRREVSTREIAVPAAR